MGEFDGSSPGLNIGVTNRFVSFSLPQVGESLCHKWAITTALNCVGIARVILRSDGVSEHEVGAGTHRRVALRLMWALLNAARMCGRRPCGHWTRVSIRQTFLIDMCGP